MGLIAHYRLDGNADDAFGKFNGVASDVTWAAGKLGQAASFNGSTSYIDSKIGPEIFRSDASICMWVNFLDDSRGILFGNFNNVGGFAVEKHISNRLRIWFNDSLDYYTPNNVVTTGNWHHLTFVRDTKANQWRIYVDGALVGSYGAAGTWTLAGMSTMWIGRDIRTGVTTTYGSLDDVRIYDHALSVREVRDLAMGLAVHYPMLDFQEPTENLYPMPAVEGNYFTSAFDNQYGYGVNTNAQWVVDNSDQPVAGLSVQKVSRIESGVSQILYLRWDSFFPAMSLAPGQSVTISFWYYGTYGTSIMPYIGGGTGGVVFADSGGDRQVIAVPVRQWHRVSFTLTNPTLETKTYGYGWMRLHYNTETVALSNQEFWKFTAVQTELKPYPTEYTQGVRSARVIDTSGQGADAPLALATTPKWIEESPTGRGSYLLTNDATKRIDLPLVDLGSTLTYSCWAKQDSSEGHMYKFIVSSGRDYGGAPRGVNVLSQSGVITVLYGGGPQGNGTLSSGVSVVGVWRHIVFTHDMVNGAKLYVDGVLTATGPARTIDYSQANNRTVIGKMAYSYTGTTAYFPFSGPISDVRFYASALTAEQVKELYQQRASLDSQGNFYASLLREISYRHEFSSLLGWASYGQQFGSTALQGDRCLITNTTGGANDVVAIASDRLVRVGEKVRVVARNASGRHAALVGLAVDKFFPYPHAAAMTGVSVYARADDVTATLSGRDGTSARSVMVSSGHKDFREFSEIEIHRASSSLFRFYKNGVHIGDISLPIAQPLRIYHSVDGHTKPCSVEILSVEVLPCSPSVTKTGEWFSGVSEVGITDGMVAYYPLNKDARDYSGNGLHGVVSGATAVGGGFDGKGAHLFAANNNIVANNVTLGSATSFCMWACMDNATPAQMLFSTDRSWGYGCDLYFSGGVMSWNIGDGHSNPIKNNGVNVAYPSTGVWHHFAVINDPVSLVLSLYVDGVLYGTAAHRDTTQANRRFIVGNYNATTTYAWAGKIANVKIFNRALTAQEIAVEYKRTGPTKMAQHQGVTYIQGEFKEV